MPPLDSSTHIPDLVEDPTAVFDPAHKKQRKWYYFLWDTFDKSPEERRFLFKLDAALLTYASLGVSGGTPFNNLVPLTL